MDLTYRGISGKNRVLSKIFVFFCSFFKAINIHKSTMDSIRPIETQLNYRLQ